MPTLISFLIYAFSIIPSQGHYAVTTDPQAVTYYTLANQYYGADVLLAHEEKAGAAFMTLKAGDTIRLTYPDGLHRFIVAEIQRYTATAPLSAYSYFIDEAGNSYGSEELGRLIYTDGRLVLQTCTDGAKGRLFVIAYPAQRHTERQGR